MADEYFCFSPTGTLASTRRAPRPSTTRRSGWGTGRSPSAPRRPDPRRAPEHAPRPQEGSRLDHTNIVANIVSVEMIIIMMMMTVIFNKSSDKNDWSCECECEWSQKIP